MNNEQLEEANLIHAQIKDFKRILSMNFNCFTILDEFHFMTKSIKEDTEFVERMDEVADLINTIIQDRIKSLQLKLDSL